MCRCLELHCKGFSSHLANLCIKKIIELSFNVTAVVVQLLMKSHISTISTGKEIVVYCAAVVRLNLNFPSLCLTMTLFKYHMIVKPPVFIQIHHRNIENQAAELFFHHLLSAEAAGAGNRISAPKSAALEANRYGCVLIPTICWVTTSPQSRK